MLYFSFSNRRCVCVRAFELHIGKDSLSSPPFFIAVALTCIGVLYLLVKMVPNAKLRIKLPNTSAMLCTFASTLLAPTVSAAR